MMTHSRLKQICLALACLLLVSSCGAFRNASSSEEVKERPTVQRGPNRVSPSGTSILDAFRGSKSTVKVNRFLWTASMDVLNFLPIQTADPFTGVISTGYGRPPGGGQAYRATVLISDPALDARSLKVALQTQRGPVSAATQRAVEDAILARARQLRINAAKF